MTLCIVNASRRPRQARRLLLWTVVAAVCASVHVFAAGADVTELPLDYVRPTLPPKISPRPVEAMAGVHPRILIPPGGTPELLNRAQTTHSKFVDRITDWADDIMAGGPQYTPPSGESPNRRALREPGQLAWAYAATGDAKYRDAAIEFALACCSWDHWDIDVDLAAGHGLTYIPMVYDWFYDDLTETQRQTIREKVRHQGNLLDSPFEGGHVVGGTWWTKELLQNHGMINCSGLFAAGAVFYHEIPEAPTWLNHAEEHFDKVFSILNHDGSWMEGMNYWGYGIEHLFLYATMARPILGRDYFVTSDHLRNAGTFFIAQTAPWIRRDDHVIPFGAASLATGTHGPYHSLYASAALSRNPRVQDIANVAWDANLGPWSPMKTFCLLWYDPTVGTSPYTTSPTAYAFPELGIVTVRDSWDPDATVLWFKCGPFQGRAASEVFHKAVSSGHARPDQTDFQIITRGVRITAYGNEQCENHSVPLFRGWDQYGERSGSGLLGSECYGKAQPELLRVTTSDVYDYLAGDAGGIYDSHAGLERFRRHIVFLKPDTFLMIDDIALQPVSSSGAPDVDWRLSTVHPPSLISAEHLNHWVVNDGGAALDVIRCRPDDYAVSMDGPIDNNGYMVPSIFRRIYRLRISSTGPVDQDVLVTLLHCRDQDDEPAAEPDVTVDGRQVFAEVSTPAGRYGVTVDLDAASCSVEALVAQVRGRHVFYNHSAYDGNDPVAGPADDNAIATDKHPLLPGQTAGFRNYTSYDKGINGIIVDIDHLPGVPTAADFRFRAGNDSSPGGWTDAPDPVSVTVRKGDGDGGADRVTIVWADGAIRNQWVQVTVEATDNTGLRSEDVFYFGNAVGETGNSAGDAEVTAADEVAVRANPHTLLVDPAGIEEPCDFNRDRKVGPTDAVLTRDYATVSVPALELITVP